MDGRFDRWWTRKATMASAWGRGRAWHVGPRCQRHAGKGRRALVWARPLALAGLGPSGETGKGRRAARVGGRRAAGDRWLLGRAGLKAEREKNSLFFFLFTTFQSIFKIFWILFWIWFKPLNTKKSNATAWVHKHVPTLIYDFKLIKVIIILSLYAHKIT
jgi:hypothetical protein